MRGVKIGEHSHAGALAKTVSMNYVTKRLFLAICPLTMMYVTNVHAESFVPSENPNSIENDPSFLELLQSDYYPNGLNGDVIRSLPIDLNGDGTREWIIEFGKQYCVADHCRIQILKQEDPDGYVWKRLFDDQVRHLEPLERDKNGWLILNIGAVAGGEGEYHYNGDAYVPMP